MGLIAGEKLCLNCKQYRFYEEDLQGRQVETENKRGLIQIPIVCEVCSAEMYAVFFDKDLPMAIAYRHTCNDEPCYDEHCEKCYGDNAKAVNSEVSFGETDNAE